MTYYLVRYTYAKGTKSYFLPKLHTTLKSARQVVGGRMFYKPVKVRIVIEE